MMEINGLFIAVIMIMAATMILGYLRGILGIVFGVVSWVFFFVFVTWVSPVINANLEDSALERDVYNRVYEVMNDETGDITADVFLDSDENVDVDKVKDALFDEYGIMLPEGLLLEVGENVVKKAESGADDVRGMILSKLCTVVTATIMKGISTLIAAVVAFLICLAAFIVIKLISDAPILGGANHAAGLLFGVLEGLLVVSLLLYAVSVFAATEVGRALVTDINNNMVLKFLYEHNLVTVLPGLLKGL